MKIYYNSKDNSYIPDSFGTEIKGKNLMYFIYGKGYVKVNLKYIQELNIDIIEPKTYLESWEIYSKYGKEVLKKVIIQNAECWQDSYCFLVSAGERACKLFDQFNIYFNKDVYNFIDSKLRCLGFISFDIIEFDWYISKQFDYDVNKNISLSDFIKLTFSKDHAECINNLIDIYDYIKLEK
jgi:hypothetical protein